MSVHRFNQTNQTAPQPGLVVREPMLPTLGGAMLVIAFMALLREFLPLSLPQQNAITSFIEVAGVAVAGWIAHRRVTPVAAPRDNLGRRLLPAVAPKPPPRRTPRSAPDTSQAGTTPVGLGDVDPGLDVGGFAGSGPGDLDDTPDPGPDRPGW